MNKSFLVAACLATAVSASGVITKSGMVRFFSTTPMENIEGVTQIAVASLDLDSMKLAIRARNNTFVFPNHLMQEHFNENYMESDKYPNSSFSGKLTGMDHAAFDAGKKVTVIVDGQLDVHGVSKVYRTTGYLQKAPDGSIAGETKFYVKIADHGIKIPTMVVAKICDSMEITAKFDWRKAEAAK